MENPHSACSVMTAIISLVLSIILLALEPSKLALALDIDTTRSIPYSALLVFVAFLSVYYTIGLIYGIAKKKASFISNFLDFESKYLMMHLFLLFGLGSFWLALIVIPIKIFVYVYISMIQKKFDVTENDRQQTPMY
jgi:hypothetical protein